MIPSQQIIILIISFLVPLYFILTRREIFLLAWIAFTVCIQLFDSQIFLNIPAARLAGLLTIPQALRTQGFVLRTRPGKLLLLRFLYLGFLGVLFGFLIPWPDEGLIRTFNQVAPGRASIYLIRTIADLSIIFFIARSVIKENGLERIFRYLLIGTTTAATGGILEFLTRIDFYGSITGLVPVSIQYRMRGFNYEPRGLGLIAAQGMILSLLIFSRQRSRKFLVLAVIHAVSVFLAGSTSAIVAMCCGIVALFLIEKKSRSLVLAIVAVGVVITGLYIAPSSVYFKAFLNNANRRLSTARIERLASNVIENIAFRMDIFDGPALLFLADNPFYLLVGTGPGLIPLPATKYLPPSPDFAWVAETGINTPPTTGIILELSNTGLIGLVMWVMICMASLRALKIIGRQFEQKEKYWEFGAGAFATAAAIYLAQNSPLSAIWPIFIGIGIGASYLIRNNYRSNQIVSWPSPLDAK